MAFAHIYARRDGRYTVRMCGQTGDSNLPGTVEYTSRAGAFPNEKSARHWIMLGITEGRITGLPEPRVIRRASPRKDPSDV